jgi:hypothetical protein
MVIDAKPKTNIEYNTRNAKSYVRGFYCPEF